MWEEYYEMAHNHDEIAEGVEIPTQVSIKVGLMLLPGTVIAAAFADPLIDFVTNFCNATNVPSFFISFIMMPLATNSSEAGSAIIYPINCMHHLKPMALRGNYSIMRRWGFLCTSLRPISIELFKKGRYQTTNIQILLSRNGHV